MCSYLQLRLVVYLEYVYPDVSTDKVMFSLQVVNSLKCKPQWTQPPE